MQKCRSTNAQAPVLSVLRAGAKGGVKVVTNLTLFRLKNLRQVLRVVSTLSTF